MTSLNFRTLHQPTHHTFRFILSNTGSNRNTISANSDEIKQYKKQVETAQTKKMELQKEYNQVQSEIDNATLEWNYAKSEYVTARNDYEAQQNYASSKENALENNERLDPDEQQKFDSMEDPVLQDAPSMPEDSDKILTERDEHLDQIAAAELQMEQAQGGQFKDGTLIDGKVSSEQPRSDVDLTSLVMQEQQLDISNQPGLTLGDAFNGIETQTPLPLNTIPISANQSLADTAPKSIGQQGLGAEYPPLGVSTLSAAPIPDNTLSIDMRGTSITPQEPERQNTSDAGLLDNMHNAFDQAEEQTKKLGNDLRETVSKGIDNAREFLQDVVTTIGDSWPAPVGLAIKAVMNDADRVAGIEPPAHDGDIVIDYANEQRLSLSPPPDQSNAPSF